VTFFGTNNAISFDDRFGRNSTQEGLRMIWTVWDSSWQQFIAFYEHWKNYPEVVLLAGVMFFLILRRRFRASLLLAFGISLCFANYFLLRQYAFLAIPPLYAMGFGAVSIILLLLLLYQFIHTA
jgi:hypothetical protein